MSTRSKTTVASASVVDIIQNILKSEEFKQLLHSTIQEAVSAALTDLVEPLKKTISVLEEKVSALESRLARVSNTANENEQYSRRHNIRISGFEEEKGEDCMEKIVKFCNEKLIVVITEDHIDRAHRVGKPSEGKQRAIIVRLKAHKDKIAILRKRKDLINSNFYVNEDLTRINQKLLYTVRKECGNVDSAWTIDGKIFVKRASDEKRLRIVSRSDLSNYELL